MRVAVTGIHIAKTLGADTIKSNSDIYLIKRIHIYYVI